MREAGGQALGLIEGSAEAAAVLHPLRRRILEDLREADSASGLSRRLGIPRQKLNYHLRELEKASLVELVEERRRGNCIERIFRSTARSWVIDPDTLGRLAADPEEVRDRFSSSYLIALAARVIGDLGRLRKGASKAGKRLPTVSMETEIRFADAGRRKAFVEELGNEIARLTAKYHDENAQGGRRFTFLVGGYPSIKRKRNPGSATALTGTRSTTASPGAGSTSSGVCATTSSASRAGPARRAGRGCPSRFRSTRPGRGS
jgi:DNA-binding transcriptional ArsR family regulator